MTKLEEVVTKFNSTGICEIDIDKLVELWVDDSFYLSQWHDEFTLVEREGGKVMISRADALDLIENIGLIDRKSTVFNHAHVWYFPYSQDFMYCLPQVCSKTRYDLGGGIYKDLNLNIKL